MEDIPIDSALESLGLTGAAAQRARALLVGVGLTTPRKTRIAVAKLGRLREIIDERFARLCGSCAARTASGGRELVIVRPACCTRCGGSDNARALTELAEHCETARLRRILVIGGSPSFREHFATVGDRLELRLVDGTTRKTKRDAKADVEWADIVVLAGSTQLAHKVSKLYADEPRAEGKVITTSRRGVSAIAEEIARHARLRMGS